VSRAASQLVGRAIPRDGRQPAGECVGVAERMQPLQRDHEDVLDEVVDVGPRSSGQQDAVHHPGKPGIQLAECGAISTPGGFHDMRDVICHTTPAT